MLSVPVAIALCSLPIIYWLHRFHRKPNTKIVSTLYLWPKEKLRPISGKTKHRFVNNLSFWLETLAALFLMGLLLPSPCSGDGQLHVWVIDTSASMSTTEVRKVLAERINSCGRYDKFTVVEAGYTTRVLGQYQSPTETKILLNSIQLNQSHSQIQEAMSLATTLTSGSVDIWTDGQTLTDGAPQPKYSIHTLEASSSKNTGVVKVDWKGRTLHTHIFNASNTPETIQVTTTPMMQIEKAIITPSVQTIVLQPNEKTVLKTDMDNQSLGLTTQIASDRDSLSADNTIHAIFPSPKPVRIATDLPQTLATKIGTIGDPAPINKLVDSKSSSPMHSDILFTSRDLGGHDNTWRVHFAPVNDTAWTQDLFLYTPHPFLEGIHLQNTLWQYDPNRRMRGRVLIESNGIPLLTEETSGTANKRILHFNIGTSSSLFQQSDWPILLQNILKAKQAELSGFTQTNITMGESVIGRGLDNGDWTIVGPNEQQIHPVETGVLSFTPQGFGTYSIQAPDGTIVHHIGVNLTSMLESTPVKQSTSAIDSSFERETLPGDAYPYHRWLWLGIVCLLLVNWRINR